MNFVVSNINELKDVADEFIKRMNNRRTFAFYGKMGVGKTTLIKEICNKLGVEEHVTSPTLSIVNEYEAKNGILIYHFDFYRIKEIEEVYDFGYEDYLFKNAICFIEWPELVESLLPENTIKIEITEEKLGIRSIRIK